MHLEGNTLWVSLKIIIELRTHGCCCTSPQGRLFQMCNATGSHLAGIIDSCQPVILCANLGLGCRWQHNSWAAGSQVPALGSLPTAICRDPPPYTGCLLREGPGAWTSSWREEGNTLIHSAGPQLDNRGFAFYGMNFGILILNSDQFLSWHRTINLKDWVYQPNGENSPLSGPWTSPVPLNAY